MPIKTGRSNALERQVRGDDGFRLNLRVQAAAPIRPLNYTIWRLLSGPENYTVALSMRTHPVLDFPCEEIQIIFQQIR